MNPPIDRERLIEDLRSFGPEADQAAATLADRGDRDTLGAILASICRDCGCEFIPETKIAAFVRLADANAVPLLIQRLEDLDESELEYDSGDIGDEFWRLQESVRKILLGIGLSVSSPLEEALQVTQNRFARDCIRRTLDAMGKNAFTYISPEVGNVRRLQTIAPDLHFRLQKPSNEARRRVHVALCRSAFPLAPAPDRPFLQWALETLESGSHGAWRQLEQVGPRAAHLESVFQWSKDDAEEGKVEMERVVEAFTQARAVSVFWYALRGNSSEAAYEAIAATQDLAGVTALVFLALDG